MAITSLTTGDLWYPVFDVKYSTFVIHTWRCTVMDYRVRQVCLLGEVRTILSFAISSHGVQSFYGCRVYVGARVWVRVYKFAYVCRYTYKCACVCVYVSACMFVCVCVCVCVWATIGTWLHLTVYWIITLGTMLVHKTCNTQHINVEMSNVSERPWQ